MTHVLDEVYGYLGRFVSYPSAHAHVAHALWVAHTHLMDAWESTPRIGFWSPEPSSGKTRALEATEPLVPNPVEAVNVTPAYLFRKVGDQHGRPVVLFDEIDTIFGPKAKDNEEIRGLLNAGHRRGAVAGRCVVKGKTVETEEIPAYCAVALAGLGTAPDTILSRAVNIQMRRRAPDEHVEPYRRRIHAPQGHRIRHHLATWANQIRHTITSTWPTMPPGVEDRDADVWEALLAVADAAGATWPERARVAAVSLVAESKESTPSLGVRLLADLRTIFRDHDALSTDTILKRLCGEEPYTRTPTGDTLKLDDAPWSDLDGKPLTPRGLAQRLKPYGVKSLTVRIDNATPKGYRRADLWDPWARYLTSPDSVPQEGNDTSATTATRGATPKPPPATSTPAFATDWPATRRQS